MAVSMLPTKPTPFRLVWLLEECVEVEVFEVKSPLFFVLVVSVLLKECESAVTCR
jgi:hypothetical protein